MEIEVEYKYIFGPVPSRRLGLSLGIDLVPFKTCTLDCIYCECGSTNNLTNIRKEFVPTDEVISELNHYLNQNPKLDYLTFSGSGEPTLHTSIGIIIKFIKNKYPKYPIALLTNSTLLYQKKLREEILDIDLILPSLDAVSENIFKKINRPCNKIKNNKIINGLIKFSKIFKGKIWLEIFFVPGINDTGTELKKIKSVLKKINPDIVQLNSLDRPGTENWIKKCDYKKMQEISNYLKPIKTEIIAKYNKNNSFIKINNDTENQIIAVIKRRPCTIEDIIKMTGLSNEQIDIIIKKLLKNKKICIINQDRGIFYRLV